MFHLVSLSLQISLNVLPGPGLGLCVVAFLLFCWVGWFLSLGKFVLNHRLIPVVDRPCLALVRQCRKKKGNAATRAKPLLGRFLSPSLVALYRDDECSNSW